MVVVTTAAAEDRKAKQASIINSIVQWDGGNVEFHAFGLDFGRVVEAVNLEVESQLFSWALLIGS
jgi:hypothetical protein